VTSLAVFLLHLAQSSPGALTEQIVYLGASGLAGVGRFLVLRLFVFAGREAVSRPLAARAVAPAPVAVTRVSLVRVSRSPLVLAAGA
jgi:hypothetical protein